MEIVECVHSLNRKALKAGVLDSCEEYVNEMIMNERNERKFGWERRI
jgi:hypothetical protein